jgi:small subunit ribosomal protein S15
LDKDRKSEIIGEFKAHPKDTGTTEIQVALLTERINHLTGHMRTHRHDYHTQRGLLRLVGRRRKLLSYLSKESTSRYHQLIQKLGLRK